MKHTNRLKNTSVTVGIIGSSEGTGVTHFAIMLAGFLAAKEKYKTALIELNHTGAFEALRQLYGKKKGPEGVFCLNGVDYYSGVDSKQMANIWSRGYDYLVLDMGHLWKENQYELLRCNLSCIVGSCTEWKLQQFSDCIERYNENSGSLPCMYLSAFGVPELRKELEKKSDVRIDVIPFELTPFVLQRKNLAFFERFL